MSEMVTDNLETFRPDSLESEVVRGACLVTLLTELCYGFM
jgi:hypothetical protein